MNVLDMNSGINMDANVEQLVVPTDVFNSKRKCAVAIADIANKYNTMVLEGRVNYVVELTLDDNNTPWLNDRIHDIASYDEEWAVYNVLESLDIDTKGQVVDYVVEGQVVTITVTNPKLDVLRSNFNKQIALFYDEELMAKAQLKERQAKIRQERKARKLAQIEAERLLENRMSEAEQTMVAISNGEISIEDALAKLNPPSTVNSTKAYSIGGLKRIADRNRKAVRRLNGFKYSELVEVEGTVVMRKASTTVTKARKVAKKQVKVVYKEGDKGYTVPKGVPTPKAPQNSGVAVATVKSTKTVEDNSLPVRNHNFSTLEYKVVPFRYVETSLYVPQEIIEARQNLSVLSMEYMTLDRTIKALDRKISNNPVIDLDYSIAYSTRCIEVQEEQLTELDSQELKQRSKVKATDDKAISEITKRYSPRKTKIKDSIKFIKRNMESLKDIKIKCDFDSTTRYHLEVELQDVINKIDDCKAKIQKYNVYIEPTYQVTEGTKLELVKPVVRVKAKIREFKSLETSNDVKYSFNAKFIIGSRLTKKEIEKAKADGKHIVKVNSNGEYFNEKLNSKNNMLRVEVDYNQLNLSNLNVNNSLVAENEAVYNIENDITNRFLSTPVGRASRSASTSINNPSGGIAMNSQLLANKNHDPIITDLTHVENGSEVVKQKWTEIANKLKGMYLGLTMVQNKETKQINITQTIMSLPENKFTRPLKGIVGTLAIGDAFYNFTEENRFVDKFVAVSFDSAASQLYSKQALYMDLKKGIIAVPVVDGDNIIYKNIRTGRPVKEQNLNKYVLALATASGLRGKKSIYNAIYVKLEEGETIASSILNPQLHNIVKHANKKMTREQAIKFMSRPALAWTASKALAKIECSAFYNSKFDFIKERDTFDGIAFIRASFLAKVLKITIDEACKLALQARPAGVIKVQIKVLHDDLFDVYAEFLNETGLLEITGGSIKDIDFLYDKNSRKEKVDVNDMDLEILAIGKMSEVALSKQIIEKLFLEAALMDKEAGNDNTTKEVTDFIIALGEAKITDLMMDLVRGGKTVSSDVEYIYEIINQISKNKIPSATKSAMANTLRKVAKDIDKLSFTDGNMFYHTVYTDTAQLFGIEVIHEQEIYYPKMNKIDGKKGILFKYPSMGGKEFYSFETISFDTICKRLNSAKMKAKIRKALIADYKRISKDLVVLPASREVFNSCAGMDIDMDAAAIVFTELVVRILHGKEEAVELITEKIINNKPVSKDVKNRVDAMLETCLNLESKKNTDSFAKMIVEGTVYNPSKNIFYSSMFSSMTTNDIKSVGEITIQNDKTIAIAIETIKGDFKAMMAVLKENNIRTNGKNEDYKGLPVVGKAIELSEMTIAQMLKEANSLKLNHDNLIKLALDLNRCFRLYQETTIDAAKTGIAIAVAIMVNSIELKSLQKVKYEEKTNDNGITYYVIERQEKELKPKAIFINGKKVYVDPILIEDSMSKIQDHLIEFAMTMKDSIESKNILYSFIGKSSNLPDGSMESIINNAVDKFSLDFPLQFKYLLETKAIYSILVGEYVKALNKLDDESEAEKAMLKSQFKLKLESLSNTVEKLLNNMKGKTPQSLAMNKGLVLVGIGALTRKGTVSPNSPNKFAFNIAPHYALTYALASDRYVADCNVLHCADHVEGEVEVIKGFSADNSLIVKESFKHREGGKATVNVTRDEEGKVRVTETRFIEIPEIDKNKSTIVLDAKIGNLVDCNNKPILDASGSTINKAVCDAGKVLKAMSYDLFAIKNKAGDVKFTFELKGEEHSLIFPADKIRLNDMKTNSKYKVTFGYIAAHEFDSENSDKNKVQDGRVVLELSR